MIKSFEKMWQQIREKIRQWENVRFLGKKGFAAGKHATAPIFFPAVNKNFIIRSMIL
jgi:hypothetical protein